MNNIPEIEITESQIMEGDANGNISSLLGDNSKLAERIERGNIKAEKLLEMNISMPKLAARITDSVLHIGGLTSISAAAGAGTIMSMGRIENKLGNLIKKPDNEEAIEEISTSFQDIEAGEVSTANGDMETSPSDLIEGLSTGSFDGLTGGLEGLLAAGGTSNVIIQGLPAWRALIDVHLCPFHGPGVVIKGSMTVFINGFPATRILDTVVEWIPNLIIQGSPTVLIGD